MTIPFGMDMNSGEAGVLVQVDPSKLGANSTRHRYVRGGPYLYDADTVLQLKCHDPYVPSSEEALFKVCRGGGNWVDARLAIRRSWIDWDSIALTDSIGMSPEGVPSSFSYKTSGPDYISDGNYSPHYIE